jgi:hypothetical protein
MIGRSLATTPNHLAHFKEASWFWAAAIVAAAVLALLLRETGRRAVSAGRGLKQA